MHNTHLGRIDMIQAKSLEVITPEQYGNQKVKDSVIQALKTRLFYNFTRKKKIPELSIFADLVSNYDLVAHSIDFLSIKRVNV